MAKYKRSLKSVRDYCSNYNYHYFTNLHTSHTFNLVHVMDCSE